MYRLKFFLNPVTFSKDKKQQLLINPNSFNSKRNYSRYFLVQHQTLKTPKVEPSVVPGRSECMCMRRARGEGQGGRARRCFQTALFGQAIDSFIARRAPGTSFCERNSDLPDQSDGLTQEISCCDRLFVRGIYREPQAASRRSSPQIFYPSLLPSKTTSPTFEQEYSSRGLKQSVGRWPLADRTQNDTDLRCYVARRAPRTVELYLTC